MYINIRLLALHDRPLQAVADAEEMFIVTSESRESSLSLLSLWPLSALRVVASRAADRALGLAEEYTHTTRTDITLRRGHTLDIYLNGQGILDTDVAMMEERVDELHRRIGEAETRLEAHSRRQL